jgi:hypothetical protein
MAGPMPQRCSTGDAWISKRGVGEDVSEVRLEVSVTDDGGDELGVVVDERDAGEFLEVPGTGFKLGAVRAEPGLDVFELHSLALTGTRLTRPSGCLVMAGALTS